MEPERARTRSPRHEAYERTAKFTAALIWGTMELAYWGARPAALAFIGSVLGITEGVRAFVKIREQANP